MSRLGGVVELEVETEKFTLALVHERFEIPREGTYLVVLSKS